MGPLEIKHCIKQIKYILSPGLHVVDDTEVVLVSADAALDLVEEIPQLHEDNQAGHGEPDVSKKLTKDMWAERLGGQKKRLN